MYRKAGVRIGNVTELGTNIWIDINFKNMVTIGNEVILAGHTLIISHSFVMSGYREEGFGPVIIKDNARIGMRCVLLPGVTVGENSVVGAGSVVARDIPPNCLAVGVPAKPIRYFDDLGKEKQKVAFQGSKLYVKCKSCGLEFWSAIRCKKEQFKNLELADNHHCCPHCRHDNRYDEQDYYFLDNR